VQERKRIGGALPSKNTSHECLEVEICRVRTIKSDHPHKVGGTGAFNYDVMYRSKKGKEGVRIKKGRAKKNECWGTTPYEDARKWITRGGSKGIRN